MILKRALAGALALACMAFAAADTKVTVTPTDLHGWAPQTAGTGAEVSFVAGPEGNPCGPSSLELQVGADGNNTAQFRNTNYEGTPIANLTKLSYALYVDQDGSGGQAPYVILNVDQDNNGTVDDLLFFEPVYQTGTYGGDPVPNQGAPVPGEWKTYDALAGGWWSFNAGTFGPPLTTLATYLQQFPNAVIRNSSTGGGGVRLVVGGGAGAWDNFRGMVDCVDIGVSGDTTTFDFEVEGAPPTDFVDVNGDEEGTTSIPNATLGDGKTIQEKVDEAAENAKNHGAYVSAINALARQLVALGIISDAQKTELSNGAAKSDIGKKSKGK